MQNIVSSAMLDLRHDMHFAAIHGQEIHGLGCKGVVQILEGLMIGPHLHIICNQVDGVEADSKLTDQIDVVALLHLLKEGCSGKGTKSTLEQQHSKQTT